MNIEEANKLIAEFMGMGYSNREYYRPLYKQIPILPSGSWINQDELLFHESWDWLMPVITRVKNIDRDWIDQEAQHIIDDIDNALTCCSGIEDVYQCTVDAIMNYNEWKS